MENPQHPATSETSATSENDATSSTDGSRSQPLPSPSWAQVWARRAPALLAVSGSFLLLLLGRCSEEFAQTVILGAVTGQVTAGLLSKGGKMAGVARALLSRRRK